MGGDFAARSSMDDVVVGAGFIITLWILKQMLLLAIAGVG
jgi:hypothetical protein